MAVDVNCKASLQTILMKRERRGLKRETTKVQSYGSCCRTGSMTGHTLHYIGSR